MIEIWEGPKGWFYEIQLRNVRQQSGPFPDIHEAFQEVAKILDSLRKGEYDEAN